MICLHVADWTILLLASFGALFLTLMIVDYILTYLKGDR